MAGSTRRYGRNPDQDTVAVNIGALLAEADDDDDGAFRSGFGRPEKLSRLQVLGGCCDRAFIKPCLGECRRNCQTKRAHRCGRSEEHTSELQSLMLIPYAVF